MPLCFLRASGKVGSFISVSIVVSERMCDGVSVPEAS